MQILPDQRYDCLHCGKSCSQNWLVPVDPAVEARLADVSVYDPPSGMKRMASRQGVCVLRTDRCSRYAHAPRSCQQFPYMPVDTPDGIFLGVSFFCTAVQQNHGRSLELPEGLVIPRVDGPFAIGAGSEATLAWPDYRLLEEVPVERSLWALAELAGMAPAGEIPRQYVQVALERARPELLASDEALRSMTDFFALNLLVWLRARQPGPEAVQALLADEPCEFLGGRLSELPPPPDCSAMLERYRGALMFRKFLVQHRPVLENLVLLHLIGSLLPLLASLGSEQDAVDRLERDLVTHALGAPAHKLLPAFAQAYVEQVGAA